MTVQGPSVAKAAQVLSDPEPTQRPGRVFRSGPVLAVAMTLTLGLLTEHVPQLGSARFLSTPPSGRGAGEAAAAVQTTDIAEGEAELSVESRSLPGMATPSADDATRARGPSGAHQAFGGHQAPLDLSAIATEDPPIALIDPGEHSLDHFFSALARTQRKLPGEVTRIAHFGDSIVVSDYVSGTLRRKFQEAFGDAGHGYMLIANPWPAYFHNDVFRFATKGFRVSRIVGPTTKDGLYGLGGVTFRASSGVLAQFGTADSGPIGGSVSRFSLSYLAQPVGGTFELWVDGEPREEVDTQSPATEVRRLEIEVPDGPHRFEMRMRKGETRSFGVVMERAGPGVVLDALGVQGARIRFLDQQDDEHFAEELRWRDPNLVIYQFGANESGDGYAYPMDEYLATMKAVIAQQQKALPDSSCLIIGAMDRARRIDGLTSSMKIIQLIIEQQERAARELGCAYFDTYNSMGGWGSMPAWVRRGLGQADMTHPTGVGAMRIGGWIFGAIMKRYAQFLEESPVPPPKAD